MKLPLVLALALVGCSVAPTQSEGPEWSMGAMGGGSRDETPIDYSEVDGDGDGVLDGSDCDDGNATIGRRLYSTSDFEGTEGDGSFSPSPQRDYADEPWLWSASTATATGGGQQVNLYEGENVATDVVVISNVALTGTESRCEDCEIEETECEPPAVEDCYNEGQALALGILSAEFTGSGVLTFTNTGFYDVCLDGGLQWYTPSSQAVSTGYPDMTADGDIRVPAGGTTSMYYGSWTSDNGTYSPYLGEDAYWCEQFGTYSYTGVAYSTIGALLPEDMEYFIRTETDEDGDGVEDHVDWSSSYGTQAQQNIWDYQATHSSLVVGKLASGAPGVINTVVTVQNRGAVDEWGLDLYDTIPAGYAYTCDTEPERVSVNADGSTELFWNLHLAGCTNNCANVEELTVNCELTTEMGDAAYVELPAAMVEWTDGEDKEESYSLPAYVYDFDCEGDGYMVCTQTNRWRVGVLGRAALDADQDEGYHGYRCALAQNSEEDCFPDGLFMQIAEFEDEVEDDIFSECQDDCLVNTSFDQLSRTNHVGYSLKDGAEATLRFWMVGAQMYCDATGTDGVTFVSARATDMSFADGTTGLSTLNAHGVYGDYTVCEALGLPE